jgi:hypothetical protein
LGGRDTFSWDTRIYQALIALSYFLTKNRV